jgi:hypothetical protein
VTKNRNDDDDDAPGSQSQTPNEKLACLHRRLMTARDAAAALVFRLDSSFSSSSLPKNGDDRSATAGSFGVGAVDSARCGSSVIAMDELQLMTTLDDIERDLYGICGDSMALHENDDIGMDDYDVDVIDVSERSSICCPDEAAGGKRGLLDIIDDATASDKLLLVNEVVVLDATPTPCTLPPSLASSSTAMAVADTSASTQQLLRRLDEWETLNAALTAKVQAKEQEQTGTEVDDRDCSSSSSSSSSSSCPVVSKSSRRRSVAMVATVKSLREKLQRNVSSSLDSFRAESAAMHNEVLRLRYSEQLLTERVTQQQEVLCELRAANDALQDRLRVAEASLLRPQQQQSNGRHGQNDDSVRSDDDDDYTLSFGDTTTADIDEHHYYYSSNPSSLDQLFSQPLRQLTMHQVELPRESNIPLHSGHAVVPKETISFDHVVVVGRSNGTVF